MIYEFAVSPEICDSWQNLNFLRSSFGKEEGRLLSDIPKNEWQNLAFKKIKRLNFQPVEGKRIKEGIIKLKRKSLYKRNNVPIVSSENWNDHALAAHKERPFRAILTNNYYGEENCVLSNNFDLIEQELWKVPSDCIANRTAREMLEPIKPMLDCANRVILVDRNFDPREQRFLNFLAELLKYLYSRPYSPSIQTISYHLGDQKRGKKVSPEFIYDLCKNRVSHLVPNGMTLKFYIWQKDQLHDRYVLTDIGGVKYGIGLDENDGNSVRDVAISRLGEKEYKKWLSACETFSEKPTEIPTEGKSSSEKIKAFSLK